MEEEEKKKLKDKIDPFYRRLYYRVFHDKGKIKLRKEIGKYLEYKYHTFWLFPWYLWVASFIILLFCFIMTYMIYKYKRKKISNIFLIVINLIMYCLGFTLLYIGKIEIFTINRTKGFISKKKISIFCSKIEYVQRFENVDYIQICMKGTKKGAYDNRKYFIRVNLKDKYSKPIEFGFTWDFGVITFKYQICLAMIKGIVVDKVEDYSVKDESEYPDFCY